MKSAKLIVADNGSEARMPAEGFERRTDRLKLRPERPVPPQGNSSPATITAQLAAKRVHALAARPKDAFLVQFGTGVFRWRRDLDRRRR
jgi:hypothetical protein